MIRPNVLEILCVCSLDKGADTNRFQKVSVVFEFIFGYALVLPSTSDTPAAPLNEIRPEINSRPKIT